MLCYYREVRDLSRAELSTATGIPVGALQNYESKKQDIHYDHAKRLADLLSIDVDLLLDEYTKFAAPGYGQRIKEIRTNMGLSQNEFAKALGVKRNIVSIWEIEFQNHHPSRKSYMAIMALAERGAI